MAPKSVVNALKLKKNRIFLRRLWRLPFGTSKVDRVKALNSGDKKQRHLLIQVLHQILKGEIPMRKEDSSVILQSGKLAFLQEQFGEAADVKRLLTATDKEQKDILSQVNNFHILLYFLFH